MFVCTECGDSQPVAGFCPADGAPLAPVGDDPLLGTMVGVYRVARLIGLGGMGRVYKGVHPTIGSRVAIKVLSRESAGRRDLVDRFFAEAKAVNVIRHENIVDVLDLSQLPDGRPYLVMEYLDGSSLAAIVEAHKRSGVQLPIGGVARLCVEVLDGLGAAHAKGIIHRDLKPDNIYVSKSGRAKILDFGIAKLQPQHGGSATHTGALLGTPHYMSPEQASEQPVDLRADIYAIGVILFECMTLQRPFVGASMFDLLRMHLEAPPPSPRSIRSELPETVENVILSALAKPPEHRFGSAAAMSAALQHATAHLPPQQWATIQPGGVNRPSAQPGWAPTPPSSWAGGAAAAGTSGPPQMPAGSQISGPPQMPARTAASSASDANATMATYGGASQPAIGTPVHAAASHPSNRPPTQPPPVSVAGHAPPSMPAAGQVASAPATAPKSSRKAIWIAVSLLVFAASGITAAIIGGRRSKSTTSAQGSGSGSAAESVGSGSGLAVIPDRGSGDPWQISDPVDSGSGVAEQPEVPPAEDPADPFAGLEAVGGIEGLQKTLESSYAQALANIPPEYSPPELTAALKKYGSVSKIPAGERKRLFVLVQAQMYRKSAEQMMKMSEAIAGSGASRPATKDWLPAYQALKPPWALDAKHIDTVKLDDWALKSALKLASDARLLRIDGNGIFSDGHADLKIMTNGYRLYQFLSPSHTKADPSEPVGAHHERQCGFKMLVNSNADVSVVPSTDACEQKPISNPRCKATQIWNKALADGAPKNGVADLNYYAPNNDGKASWAFRVLDDAAGVNFTKVYADDC
jgi:serine/threonine protein kinase